MDYVLKRFIVLAQQVSTHSPSIALTCSAGTVESFNPALVCALVIENGLAGVGDKVYDTRREPTSSTGA